ncbi:SDR family oxidoreductase [Falsibacillus albus]|uniref:SDR family oxidoreductase n=1 Tax=Falsibacillus albus TaxID=2478915 RepID=A0A3L7K0E0_9BACI|nr:SDR family oxidoreductase [Falsibacillus albus]RLQ96523.1 SDR family oxidoreductase [Falsibacillus albus]
MNVLVIGANGTTGRHVVKLLAESNQHLVKAMIRKTEQTEDMEKLGAKPIIADLEQDFSYAVEDVNAIIFAAGSGSKTGPDKTTAIDEEGAKKAVDIACRKGIQRFIMLSSMGADNPDAGPEGLQHYLKAKQSADKHLQESSLNYTIVRPGSLTNDSDTGKIQAKEKIENRNTDISRENVAKVLVESLVTPNVYHKTFEILNGDVDIHTALEEL